jgi:hypothetical protein
VLSHRPGGRLRAALVEAGCGFVLAIDDLRAVLIDLVLGRGVALAEAVRVLASSCAALSRCSELSSGLSMRMPGDRAGWLAAADRMARHVGLSPDPEAIAAIPEQLLAGRPSYTEHDAIAWWSALDPDQRRMATGALGPFLETDLPGVELPITWTGELFSVCDRPGSRASEPIDITGRAHRIIDGPNIMLPAGSWSLTLALLCNREAADYEFLVEVAADTLLATTTLRPRAEGETSVSFEFAFDGLAEKPVAIRVSTVRAAFDGAISVVAARLVRAAPKEGGPAG